MHWFTTLMHGWLPRTGGPGLSLSIVFVIAIVVLVGDSLYEAVGRTFCMGAVLLLTGAIFHMSSWFPQEPNGGAGS